jgi:aspartate oxidase
MSRHAAVVRDASGLAEAAREIADVQAAAVADGADPPAARELGNMAAVAAAIVAAASRREESRGAHFRADFAATDPTLDGRHLVLDGAGWRWGTLDEARTGPVAPSGRRVGT